MTKNLFQTASWESTYGVKEDELFSWAAQLRCGILEKGSREISPYWITMSTNCKEGGGIFLKPEEGALLMTR